MPLGWGVAPAETVVAAPAVGGWGGAPEPTPAPAPAAASKLIHSLIPISPIVQLC